MMFSRYWMRCIRQSFPDARGRLRPVRRCASVDRKTDRRTWGIVQIVLLGLMLAAPAAAQDVDIEGSVQGDGFARSGRCVVTPEAIYVVPGTDDTQARVHIKCKTAGSSRIIHVQQVEVMPDGTRRVYQDTQFDFGGNKSPDKDFLTDINTSCGPGSGNYSMNVTAQKGNNAPDVEEWTTTVTLPVDGCN